MAESIVTLSADDTALLKSWQKQQAAQAKTDEGYKSNEKASKKAADQAIQDAARIERESKRAATEMFREHDKLLKSLQAEKRQAALEGQSLTRQVAIQETRVLLAAAEDQIDALDKVSAAKAKTTRELGKVNNELSGLFSGSLQGFGEMATGVGVVTAATAQLLKSLGLVKKAKEDALRTQEGLSDSNRRLIQVAKNPEDLAAMQKKADDTSLATGVPRDVARQIMFSARSEGFEESYSGIMAANQVVDPLAAAGVAGKVPALFQGSIGSIESVSLGLKAAEGSTLSFENMATSLPIAAEGGALVGASPEEVFATQGVLASRFKSGDEAAGRIKGFAASAGMDERMKGKGIIGAWETIRDMPEDERKDYLGKSQELNMAYEIIGQEMPKIREQKKILEDERKQFASGGGILRNRVNLAKTDPSTANITRVRKSEIEKEMTREENLAGAGGDNAVARAGADTLIEQKQANLLDRLVTTGASEVLTDVPLLAAQSKSTLASFAGDRATNAAKFLVSPAWSALSIGSDMFTGGETNRAQTTLNRRRQGADEAIDRALAGEAPQKNQPQQNQNAMAELLTVTRETNNGIKKQNELAAENNKLVAEQNRIFEANGNGGGSQAIRAQVAMAKD
jgi:hypothetical protein